MIRILDVHKRFSDAAILRGASLDVERGKVAVLLGMSGSGKSTLLRTINGLTPFDQGEILVDDLRLSAGALTTQQGTLHHIRQRVGMVFQQFHLFPHRSVLENVMEAPRCVLGHSREAARDAGRALLQQMGLQHLENARPSSLSGGQQQRVAIARAMAMNPTALLFDEPTSALDPRTSADVAAIITELARDGQAILVVTHAIPFARGVADWIHVMHDGRIAESGTPEQVLGHPISEATKRLLADAN